MSLIQVALLTAQDACECGMCLRGQSFTCDMCGGTAPWCRGSDDCVERYLASPGGGICDECAGKLPPHVWDAAERWDEARRPFVEPRARGPQPGTWALLALVALLLFVGCQERTRDAAIDDYVVTTSRICGPPCFHADEGRVYCRCRLHDGGAR